MKAILQTIHTVTITDANKLIDEVVTVILKMPDYKLKVRHKGQYPPWRMLEGKNKATWREFSQLSELEKVETTKEAWQAVHN